MFNIIDQFYYIKILNQEYLRNYIFSCILFSRYHLQDLKFNHFSFLNINFNLIDLNIFIKMIHFNPYYEEETWNTSDFYIVKLLIYIHFLNYV